MHKKILLSAGMLAIIFGTLAILHFREKAPLVELPWSTVLGREAYLQKELKKFQESYPAGTPLSDMIGMAKLSGYSSSFWGCTQENRKKIEIGGGCEAIQSDYGTKSAFTQNYDILYDGNMKIVSVQMGMTQQSKD